MKCSGMFEYKGLHTRKEMIEKFLEFEHDILLVKGNYIYSNGLLHEIKNICFIYPYTVMELEYFSKG